MDTMTSKTTTDTMRAAVVRRFGGPEAVQVERMPRPVPKADELLVRVHASTVSIADHRVRTRDVPKGMWFYIPLALGVFRPRKRVLGMDIAGVVEAVGQDVEGFEPGDEVVAMLGGDFGGHAEYARVPVSKAAIARKPANLGWEESVALVFGGHTALSFLDRTSIEPGSEVLVNGASGAVGTAAVQLAKHRGARVTAVTSAANAELVRSLGADRVIDYTREDFARDGSTYDVIVECVGNAPYDRVAASLKPRGALLLVITGLRGLLRASRDSRRGRLVTALGAPVSHEEFAGLMRLAERGEFRPVIDRTFDLDDVAEAHRYVDGGHKRGNVVLRIC